LALAPWLCGITGQLERGLALFIDYGYPRREYYLPERRDGTLMCHYRHRAHGDAFFWPGLQDITAWVDFTALAEAADTCGLEVLGYTSQAMFLLGCGLDRIVAEGMAGRPDGGLALSAEARQLTLPGMMGERFQAMGLGRGLDPDDMPLCGFSLQDLRYRL
jgi:SAM-dependent MidA family methyltransferase